MKALNNLQKPQTRTNKTPKTAKHNQKPLKTFQQQQQAQQMDHHLTQLGDDAAEQW